MLAGLPHKSGFLPLACVISLATLFCTASPARSETSAHRLKRKLHKVEKETGKVAVKAAEVAAEATFFGGALLLDAGEVAGAIILQIDFDDLVLLDPRPGHGLVSSHESSKVSDGRQSHAGKSGAVQKKPQPSK
jgi:hypothetical protein